MTTKLFLFGGAAAKQVASGILPDVEPGFQPGGSDARTHDAFENSPSLTAFHDFSGRQDAALYGRQGCLPLPRWLASACWLACSLIAFSPAAFSATLEEDFQNPPVAARPYVWWHWMGANFSKAGITKDLEAMKAAGIGGATIFNLPSAVQESHAPTLNNPWPDQTYRSPKYWEAIRHAAAEADRLGLEIGLHNTVGYSTTGGPWIDEARSMQRLVWSRIEVSGGAPVITNIAPPKLGKDDGWGATGRQISFYRDIAVLAVPAGSTNLAVSDVLDLTKNFSASGELNWNAPAGHWIVYRVGHSSTGRSPHPVPDDVIGKTLEADKISLEQTKFHWETVINPLKEHLGPLFGKSFRHFLIDSYEAGNQNWTSDFRDEFTRRKGYDPLPWLVTFGATVKNGSGKTERIVGSAEQTARFEWDYRDMISTLYYENGWQPAAEIIHAAGAKLQHEAYGGPFDTVEGSALADLPMTEFWTGRSGSANPSVVGAARAAGKRIVGAEAFTGRPEVSQWTETPAFLKTTGDAQFASGVNRMVLHHWVHQPFDDRYKPGMGMGWWGTHFSRNQTWFEPGKEFFRYLGRVQALLQRGEAPADFVSVGTQQGDGDVIPLRDLKDVRVVDGKILLPSGRKYAFISFPNNGAMLPEVLTHVKKLLADGATVVCTKPMRSPSLKNFPKCDDEVRSLATELWGGGKETLRQIGRGKLFTRGDVSVALRELGIVPIAQVVAAGILPAVEPGFQPGGKNVGIGAVVGKPNASAASSANPGGKMPPSTSGKMPDATLNIRIAAREDGATKIFFVANLNQKAEKFTASFRVRGLQPELWDAETGATELAPLWREKDGRSEVDLSLGAAKSVFVVFRENVAAGILPAVEPGFQPAGKNVGHGAVVGKPNASAASSANPGGRMPPSTSGKMPDATSADRLASIEADGDYNLSSDKQGRAVISASTNISGTAVFASGKRVAFDLKPAAAIPVTGTWSVDLAPAVGAKKQIELPALKSLSESDDAAVKYFSGTATYRTTINVDAALLGAGKRVKLDLGDVRDLVTVRVNGKNIGVLWHPPFACDITSALQPGANTLELAVANTWHNRLVGDEQFPPDFEFGMDRGADKGRALKAYPDWFVKNQPRSETNRLAFVNWYYHRKDTPLIPSGLLGPVKLVPLTEKVIVP
jgi:hypothetical protein